MHTLRRVVAEDLRTDFYPGTPPPVGCRDHAMQCLMMTLRRHLATRGRTEKENLFNNVKEEAVLDLCKELLELSNGMWWIPRIQHFCYKIGCCSGHDRTVAIERITALLYSVWFRILGTSLPSIMRWYTFGPTLSHQAGGLLCHNIMPRVMTKALKAQDASEINEEVSSWQQHCAKKTNQSLQFLGEQPSSTVVVLNALITTEPVDHLSGRCQHLDAAGNGMKELVAADGSLRRCLSDLRSMLKPMAGNATHESKNVAAAVRHIEAFGDAEFTRESYYSSLRTSALELGSGIWSMLVLRIWFWPWKLLRGLVGPNSGNDEDEDNIALALFRSFFHEDECCLDIWVSLWIRKALEGPRDVEANDAGTSQNYCQNSR